MPLYDYLDEVNRRLQVLSTDAKPATIPSVHQPQSSSTGFKPKGLNMVLLAAREDERAAADSQGRFKGRLIAIQHALESFKAASTRSDWEENRQAPDVCAAINAVEIPCADDDSELCKRISEAAHKEKALWSSDKFRYNPQTVAFDKPLNADGVSKDVFKMVATDGLSPSERVFKPENPIGKADAPRLMGIDDIASRLGARAVASYKIGKLLNTRVLARTRFAECTVRRQGAVETTLFGSLQNFTGGTSLHKQDDGQRTKLYQNPEILKQLQQLQLVDYLTGQGDRHANNIHIVADKRVLGIDHDFAFPAKPMAQIVNEKEIKNRGLPNFIDEQTKEALLKLQPSDLAVKIAPYLSVSELEQTQQRLTEVKLALKSQQIKVMTDWSDNEIKQTLNSKNSYLYTNTAGDVVKTPNLLKASEGVTTSV